jgi:hypothetical protein
MYIILALLLALCLPLNVGAEPCVTARPSVTMSASRINVTPGAAGVVHVVAKNNDSASCAPLDVDIGPLLMYPNVDISGYGLVDQPGGATLDPGSTIEFDVRVGFGLKAVPGQYATLNLQVFPYRKDPDDYYLGAAVGQTKFYVVENGICIDDADRDLICKILCSEYTL